QRDGNNAQGVRREWIIDDAVGAEEYMGRCRETRSRSDGHGQGQRQGECAGKTGDAGNGQRRQVWTPSKPQPRSRFWRSGSRAIKRKRSLCIALRRSIGAESGREW